MVSSMPTNPCAAVVIAKRIGVHPNSVWSWRRTGRLPKNPVIRAAYLKAAKALGLSKEVAK